MKEGGRFLGTAIGGKDTRKRFADCAHRGWIADKSGLFGEGEMGNGVCVYCCFVPVRPKP